MVMYGITTQIDWTPIPMRNSEKNDVHQRTQSARTFNETFFEQSQKPPL